MSNNRLADLETFVAVVEAGSFTGAARRLGRSKASVSRQVRSLEERLGVPLLLRTTRSMSLTDAGAAYHQRAAAALADLEEAESAIGSLHASPRGRLRISLPMAYGLRVSASILLELGGEHPGLELDLSFSDRYVDLVGEGFDLAVRIGHLEDSSLIARRLTATRMVVCASPTYLEGRPRVVRPSDLLDHDCLLYAQQVGGTAWRFADGETVTVTGRLRSDSGDALLAAALAGWGVAQLPDFYLAEPLASGALVPLLEEFEPEPLGVWAVYPQRRHLSVKVRLAVDRLAERLAPDG
jgi:DNA-binding transcriptional LysR family regulator